VCPSLPVPDILPHPDRGRGAFAIFQYGGSTLTRLATPQGHFTPPPAASGPDYAAAASWLARPATRDDPAAWVPEGMVTTKAEDPAATFYIHPTTYLERDRWNAALDPGGQAGFRARLFVQSQASAFNAVSEIWAPRYRQAAFGAFLLNSEDATMALDLAYRDVLAAFDAFIAAQPDSKPIILAGHSQGALRSRAASSRPMSWAGHYRLAPICPRPGWHLAPPPIRRAASCRGKASPSPPMPRSCSTIGTDRRARTASSASAPTCCA